MKIISPCISICKNNPNNNFVSVVVERMKKKKNLEKSETTNHWKKENLNILKSRMSESQLKTFEQSYKEKLSFGKLVYSKNLEKKP